MGSEHRVRRRTTAAPRRAGALRVGAADDREETEADQLADAALQNLMVMGARTPLADMPELGATRIRRNVVRRLVMDPAFDDEVFEVATAKREAEVTNLNLVGGKIGPEDPRRQKLESHFGNPENRKGNRSYPASGPEGRRDRSVERGRTEPEAPPGRNLPAVLVLGAPDSTGAMMPAQMRGEHALREAFEAATGSAPALVPVLDPLREDALSRIRTLSSSKMRKSTVMGVGETDDDDTLGKQVDAITSGFAREAKRIASQAAWEETVRARNAFVASKADPPLATQALERAAQDIALAAAIYDKIYEPLALAAPAIAEVTSSGSEAALLALHPSIPTAAWAPFLVAATASAEMLTFARANGAALTGADDAGPVLRVWQANPGAVTTVDQARAVLALPNLVAGRVVRAVSAAKLLGTPQVPDIAALTLIDGSGVFATLAAVTKVAKLGGDLAANQSILALADKVKEEHVTAFNAKCGRTPLEGRTSWGLLLAHIPDLQRRAQIVRSVALATNATLAGFTDLVTNHASLNDRTLISSARVATLLTSGLLTARSKLYTSGTYGRGCIYTFELAGLGGLKAEWHIHFKGNGAKAATSVGAGWKNQSEKQDVGVKTFDTAPALIKALEAKGAWRKITI